MRINFNPISFCESQKFYRTKDGSVREFFDNNNKLIRRVEKDCNGRDVDTKWFDEKGNVIENLHKDYYENKTENGYIETFKGKTQEYTRKAYTKIENGFKHIIDDFQPKDGRSYINEFIHDMNGELVKMILNGKVKVFKK